MTTNASGGYSLALPTGVSAPCMLRVTGGTFGGVTSPYVLHSFAVTTGIAHITLVTELIVARAGGLVPISAFNGYTPGFGVTMAAALADAKSYVRAQLGATLPTVPMPTTDFIVGPLAIGDIYDKFLEALRGALASAGHTLAELTNAAVAGGSFAPYIASGGGGSTSFQNWGSITISGNGLPTNVPTTHAPNALPIVSGSTIAWQVVSYSSTSASPTTVQTFSATFSSLLSGSLIGLRIETPAAGAPGSGLTSCSVLPGCGGVTHDPVNKTLTLVNVQMVIGSVATTLNGTLRYSDLAARAGTTMTAANLGTCPTTSSNPAFGEPDASSLGCIAGTLNGFSDSGTGCSLVVSTAAKSARVTVDALDSSITFLTAVSGGNTISNLQHAYTNAGSQFTHSFGLKDPLTGVSAQYRDTSIVVTKPTAPSGPYTVRAEGTVRTGGTNGPISSRGACTARL